MAAVAADGDLDQIMAVTAADRTAAAALLAAAGGSVQRAINMHFESDRVPPLTASDAGADPGADDADPGDNDDEKVRAPIPPRAEVLLDSSHVAGNYALPSRRSRLRQSDSVFDKFRDFSAEIRMQESQLAGGVVSALGESSQSRQRGLGQQKLRTLEEIFRPPLDLMFRGTFQAARDHGVAQRKWLMVNVQNTEEFSCQVLNRDVWSSQRVRDIVRANFVFWQVYHEGSEGLKYKTFYPVARWPYVAVLDPRTGELLTTWNNLDKSSAIELLIDFLEAHKYSEDAPPAPKRPRDDSVLEMDEEEQLRLAIEKSLQSEPTPKRAALVDCSESSDDDAGDVPDEDEDFWAESGELSAASAPLSPGQRSAAVTSPTRLQRTAAEDVNDEASPERCSVAGGVTSDRDGKLPGGGDSVAAADKDTAAEPCGTKAVPEHASGEDWRRHLGDPSDPSWTLALRLPDGGRVQLDLPCSSTLRCVIEYVAQLGYPSEQHILLATFPRRVLSEPECANQTLQEAGLHSQDTVFVQIR